MAIRDPVATNQNDKMHAGDDLKPGEVEEFEDEELYSDNDGAGPSNEDEDEPGLLEDAKVDPANKATPLHEVPSSEEVDETLAGGLQYPGASEAKSGG